MGEMADYYMEQDMDRYFEEMVRHHEMSDRYKNKAKRYQISDDEIRLMIFTTSTKALCMLTDKVIMDEYALLASESEIDKMISIAAYGLEHFYLTAKQQWCLAAFCLNYLQNGKPVEPDPKDVAFKKLIKEGTPAVLYTCEHCKEIFEPHQVGEMVQVSKNEYDYLCPNDGKPLSWGLGSKPKCECNGDGVIRDYLGHARTTCFCKKGVELREM